MFYIFLLPVIQHATEKLSRHPSTIRTSKVILSISMSQFRRIYRDSFVVIHTSTSSTIHIVLTIPISSYFLRSLLKVRMQRVSSMQVRHSNLLLPLSNSPSNVRNRLEGGSIVNRRRTTQAFSMQLSPSQHTFLLSH